MLREIQADAFILDVHAQADQRVHDFEQDERGDAGKDRREQHADGLVDQLTAAPPASDTATPLT